MLFLSSKKFPSLYIPLKCWSIRKGKISYFTKLPITCFSCWISFFKLFPSVFLYYLTEQIVFFCFCFIWSYKPKQPIIRTYYIHSRSTIKIATPDLFWEISQKYKQKFTCMIHNKLFTPRTSVNFVLNGKKLLLLHQSKITANDIYASKTLH